MDLVMNDKSWNKIKIAIQRYKNFNEQTFLSNLWMALFPDVRDASQHAGVTLADLSPTENPAVWTERAWSEDFLCITWSHNFNSELINDLAKPPDNSVDKIFNIQLLLKTPRPHLTFGLDKTAFTRTELHLGTFLGAALQPGLYHPFFAIEAKNVNGTVEEAAIQCCRAGAAMVHCRRTFNMKAKKPTEAETSGADSHSFVFTLALVPTFAIIYVHWAEVGAANNAITYHMKCRKFQHENKRRRQRSASGNLHRAQLGPLLPEKGNSWHLCEDIRNWGGGRPSVREEAEDACNVRLSTTEG